MFRDRRRGRDLERALGRIQSEPDRGAQAQDQSVAADEELKELSALAMLVKESLEVPGPSQTFRRATKARLLRRMRLQAVERAPTPAPRQRPSILRPAYALASLVMVIALLTTGIGVGHAAGNALPGEALYGVKQRIEQGRLLLSISEEGDFRLLSEFADERLFEIERLVLMGKDDLVEVAAADYGSMLAELTEIASGLDPARGTESEPISERLSHHLSVLNAVKGKVPEHAQEAIQRAIERSGHSQEVLDALERGDSPSDLAPGQGGDPEGPPEGVDPGPPEGVEPGPPEGVDPGPPEGVDPGPPEGVDPGPPEGVDPGPPDGVDPGPPDEVEPGPPDPEQDSDKGNKSNRGRRNRGKGNPDAPGLTK